MVAYLELLRWADRAIACTACPLHQEATRKSFDRAFLWHAVEEQPVILIVGLAPAYCEDRTGLPLVGGWELASSRCAHCQRLLMYQDSHGAQHMGCFDYFLGHSGSYKGRESACPYPEGEPCRWVDDATVSARLPAIVAGMAGQATGAFHPTTAGMLLDKMLQVAGYTRGSEVDYRIEKHRLLGEAYTPPPINCTLINLTLCRSVTRTGVKVDNRDPNAAEVDACKPLLDAYLDAVQPQAIVALGRLAITQFLGDTPRLGDVTRREHPGPRGIPLLPLCHPAYYLRRWEDRSTAYEIAADEAALRALREAYLPQQET